MTVLWPATLSTTSLIRPSLLPFLLSWSRSPQTFIAIFVQNNDNEKPSNHRKKNNYSCHRETRPPVREGWTANKRQSVGPKMLWSQRLAKMVRQKWRPVDWRRRMWLLRSEEFAVSRAMIYNPTPEHKTHLLPLINSFFLRTNTICPCSVLQSVFSQGRFSDQTASQYSDGYDVRRKFCPDTWVPILIDAHVPTSVLLEPCFPFSGLHTRRTRQRVRDTWRKQLYVRSCEVV